MLLYQHKCIRSNQNWTPVKVWPKDHPAGATLLATTVRPSLEVTLNERLCPSRWELLCQFWPQFLDIGCQLVFEPLMETAVTSPAPPTLVISTRLKYEWPLIVNLMPPFFWQGTLYVLSTIKSEKQKERIK
jgi:hypothetical protein